jgi:transposase-like protein
MEQAQSEGSELASGEGANAPTPSPPADSATVSRRETNKARRIPPTRRKLSDEQEGEVTRLYATTPMPVSDIARMFGIAESSVYRVAQRRGAVLRGSTAVLRGRFRIRFRAERVVQARDIQDALRQAESLDAIEVTGVTLLSAELV